MDAAYAVLLGNMLYTVFHLQTTGNTNATERCKCMFKDRELTAAYVVNFNLALYFSGLFSS